MPPATRRGKSGPIALFALLLVFAIVVTIVERVRGGGTPPSEQ